ncbi:DUF6241 domain-containing protein [Clostridioides difficile]
MGKNVKERLDETIKRDKREINGDSNEETVKDNNETKKEVLVSEEVKEVNKEEITEEDDDFEESNFNLKKFIVILLVLIISLSTILVLWSNGYEIVNFAFNKVNEITEEKDVEEKPQVVEETVATPVDLNEIYDKVHLMANTIIVAEDGEIWGTYQITKDDLSNVKNQVLGNDDYLYNELSKWLELDFSNAVEVHNYVWEKLGGTVGKAEKLNDEKIQEVIQLLGE